MAKIALLLIITLNVLTACQTIENGDALDKTTLSKIKELGLLDENEKIIKYYSNSDRDKAGNFFTDKRIAHYWLDERDNTKTEISFAYYKDIIAIDTSFHINEFDTISFLTVTKQDSTKFRVFIDGDYNQENAFFIEAISMWRRNKNKK